MPESCIHEQSYRCGMASPNYSWHMLVAAAIRNVSRKLRCLSYPCHLMASSSNSNILNHQHLISLHCRLPFQDRAWDFAFLMGLYCAHSECYVLSGKNLILCSKQNQPALSQWFGVFHFIPVISFGVLQVANGISACPLNWSLRLWRTETIYT